MRISFCDLCNESIPLTDFDSGKAVRRKGRAICALCEEAMGPEDGPEQPSGKDEARKTHPRAAPQVGHASRPPALPLAHAEPPAASGAGLAVTLGVIALLFSCGAAVFLLERIDQDGRELAGMRAGFEAELARTTERIENRFEARLAGAYEEAESAQMLARDLSSRIGGQTDSALLAELRAEFERLERDVRSNGKTPELQNDTQVMRLEKSLADLRREITVLSELMNQALPDSPDRLELPVTKEEPEVELPSWWSYVRDLEDDNSGKRWAAVQALGKTKDPAVAEHILPRLKDPDLFVRIASARVLGELRHMAAIPALIDALEDGDPSVREAAVVSLRALSGQNFRFNDIASPDERAKRVAAWRRWWEKNGERILGTEGA